MGERGTGPKSLVERVNGCRELDCRSAVCSGFDGFVRIWLESIRCVAMPLMGCHAFCFIGQEKAWVTAEEKEERERERAEGL